MFRCVLQQQGRCHRPVGSCPWPFAPCRGARPCSHVRTRTILTDTNREEERLCTVDKTLRLKLSLSPGRPTRRADSPIHRSSAPSSRRLDLKFLVTSAKIGAAHRGRPESPKEAARL